MIRVSLAVLAIGASLAASPAAAQSPGLLDRMPSAGDIGRVTTAPAPAPAAGAAAVGRGRPAKVQPGERPANAPRQGKLKTPRNGKRCFRPTRRTRVCNHYKQHRLVKRCTKRRGHREICHRVRIKRAALARPADLNEHSFGDLIPPVGRLYTNGFGHCSGTLIAVGVVLTAGHCLYSNGLLDGGGYLPAISFAPGQSYIAGLPEVPDWRYGVWLAQDWWASPGWQANDPGQDWGLVLLQPNADGYYPGQYSTIGTYQAWANVPPVYGQRRYSAGYPGNGIFGLDQNGNGNGQYHCDNTWEGQWRSGDPLDGTNFGLWLRCPMTGGSSGGPVFLQFDDGSWAVNGVVNQAWPNSTDSQYIVSMYLDQRFLDFYASIFG